MAYKYYVSVTTSPTSFVPANGNRRSIGVQNISTSETIYVDFGVNPSATNGAWRIPPGGSLIINANDFPEVTKDLRLVATAATNAIIRDSVDQ
jgi:hypothetical protein